MPGASPQIIAPSVNGHHAPHLRGVPRTQPKSWVRVPEGDQQHRDAAREIAPEMHKSCGWFAQGQSPVSLSPERFCLEPVSVDRSVTDFEKPFQFYTLKEGRGGTLSKCPTKLTLPIARVILRSTTLLAALPQVRALSRCPVLIACCGKLASVTGFHSDSGILVHPDAPSPEDVPFSSAIDYFNALLRDFRFTTESDRARAVAAILSPALNRSGLLGDGRCPLIVVEANDSQAGKGYLVRTIAAVYGETPRTITQREGGVGSVSESLMAGLQEGSAFIALDNWRGPVNVPAFESMLTESRVECRVPHKGPTIVDPTPTTFALTSNGAELTLDLANRSNIIRILKQPDGYAFRDWPEGGLLEHIRENQPWYLGAVWAVLREWHARGCPLAVDDGAHDFRRWARAVRYIVRDMLGLADPLEDYRAIQRSKATPSLTWLRAVLLAVKRARKDGLELRAHDLWGLCAESGIEVPGLSAQDAQREDDATRTKALQGIGRRLASAFSSRPTLDVDGTPVQRIERPGENGRPERSYVFGALGDVPGALDGPESDRYPTL